MKMGAILLVLVLGLSSVSAFSTRSRPSWAVLRSPTTVRTSAESCYYQLNLANQAGNGWQGKQITVAVDGTALFTDSLLYLVHEKSVKIPVTAGQSISLHYGDGVESKTTNSFSVTDANGLSVLSVEHATTGDYVVPSVASCECEYLTTDCPAIRVRNEWRSLSFCDRANFLDAITTFRTTPTTTHNYSTFIELHVSLSPNVIARQLFFPWHRAFILEFENALRSQGGRFACVTLPFWDWSLDFGHEKESTVITDLGGYDPPRSCLNGRFANWTEPTHHNDCVTRRDFKLNPFYPSVASTSAIELGITANSSYWFVFTYFVRNPHKSVHIYVGGSKGTMGSLASPADPLFWLHHANLDRAWAMWQDCWDFEKPGMEEAQYRDISGLLPLDGQMVDYFTNKNSTVRSMLNILALGYRYPPTYRVLKRLVGSQPVYESTTATCHWDWFNPVDFKAAGLSYRPEALSLYQEQLLSESRASYKSELEHSANYYSAMTAQLKKECDIANGTYNDDWPQAFVNIANNAAIIGPAELFKNACQLLKDKTLARLFVA